MRRRLASVFPVLALVAASCLAHGLYAQTSAPKTSVTAEVEEPVPPSFDHSAFDGLLHAHVKDGLVDYAAFKNNAGFQKYLTSLKSADLKRFEEAERIAFWLNTYNAYTIQLVASRGETESIRNINKTFGIFQLKGPWTDDIVEAAGQTLTLDDVEHRILRHDFAEPRIHFAMTFAARGGPKLRSEAYTGLKLDEQLEDQARTFIHETTKNRLDTASRVIYVSPVIGRNRADFGVANTELARFLAEYYPPGPERLFLVPPRPAPDSALIRMATDTSNGKKPDTARINAQARRRNFVYFRVIETPFDWTLNIQKRQ